MHTFLRFDAYVYAGTFIRLKCKPLENCEDQGKDQEQRYIVAY